MIKKDLQPNTAYAAVYARYSEGSHQTDQSIDGQLAEARKFAEANGLTYENKVWGSNQYPPYGKTTIS